jgi:hypothetical protein
MANNVNQKKEIGGTTFFSVGRSTPGKGFNLVEYGYQADGEGVPPEYLVRISSIRNRCTVVGVLQEDIQTRVESVWEPFINTSMLTTGNMLVQALTGSRSSLVSKATSRRLWQGSTPMVISLKLKFEAVNNTFTEVVEPCRLLQCMALPSEPANYRGVDLQGVWNIGTSILSGEGLTKALSQIPFLIPPGPTPFTTEGILSANKRTMGKIDMEDSTGGDKIFIEIGRFLSFWSVIVKEVPIVHHLKFDSGGNPISAEAQMIFESYEMMTCQSLNESYNKQNMTSNPSE